MKAISDFLKNITLNNQENIKPGSLESFKDEMILSICVLLIEVSKSDDDYDDLEKTKIIDLLEKQFSLNHDQIDTLMKMADKKIMKLSLFMNSQQVLIKNIRILRKKM